MIYLPYPSFEVSAACFTDDILKHTRIESWRMIMVLTEWKENSGYWDHPETVMWHGFDTTLATYGAVMCQEIKTRKLYADDMRLFFLERHKVPVEYPQWWNKKELHASHRAVLLKRHPGYKALGWKEEPSDLVWYPRDARRGVYAIPPG